MNGVTDPSETYFKQGLWAYDANAKAWVQLEVDASGYLQVTGLTLPPGAATAAHQVTMITALQLIDDLRNALHAIGSDKMDVFFKGQDVDVEVKQQAPADLTAALHGYIGAAWQKLPMLWGYSDRYVERLEDNNAAAGWNWENLTAVPAGEIWVIQAARADNATSQTTATKIELLSDGPTNTLIKDLLPAAGHHTCWQGAVVLKEGDLIRAEFEGCTAGDDLTTSAWGFKMDIDL